MLYDQTVTERVTKRSQSGACLHCHASVIPTYRRIGLEQAGIERWRESSAEQPYAPNRDASRQEMRSFVCGQCHVEYYCANKMTLTFPWGYGLEAGQIEQFWDETTFDDGTDFVDDKHGETGAKVYKACTNEVDGSSN